MEFLTFEVVIEWIIGENRIIVIPANWCWPKMTYLAVQKKTYLVVKCYPNFFYGLTMYNKKIYIR